jgi:hypothetical protein
MSDCPNHPQELSGWKQIAHHLGVSVRTAQTLEKEQALPVRRRSGQKGPVYALPDELDGWQKPEHQPQGKVLIVPGPLPLPTRRKWLQFARVGGVIFLAAAAGYGIPKFISLSKQSPSSYRVEGATLVVLGRNGGELWRYTFPEELSGIYKDDLPYGVILCMFSDIDGDGEVETLFRTIPRTREREWSLACFSSKGALRWKFLTGKSVVDNLGRTFAPPYWPNNFHVFPSSHGKPSQIVVCSHHNWSFPTQVAVIDGKTGKLVSEYWHRGHLLHMAVADLDGDGEPELLLGGVNDAPEYKRATLVVLDHRYILGASKNPKGGVYFQGTTPGVEKKVVFFPRTDMSRPFEFNRVTEVRVTADRITVNVAESTEEQDPCYVVYELDYSFRPINAAPSNVLMERYRQAWDRGVLPRESFAVISEQLKARLTVL